MLDDLFMANMRQGNTEYYTYLDIIEKVFGENVDKVRDESFVAKSLTNWDNTRDCIKNLRNALKANGMDFEEKKMGRYKGFRYPMCDNGESPVSALLSKQKKMRLKQLERVVKASTGLFPDSWLADLLVSARQISRKTAPSIIGFHQNARYSRIQLVPTFFDAIERKQVLRFMYSPDFADEPVELIFHPHYLKEYNQRWFVFGRCFDRDGHKQKYSICALDRIKGEVMEEEAAYLASEHSDTYEHYFDNIIGITRPTRNKIEHIVIACNSTNVANRISTKPLHRSQRRSMEEEKVLFCIDVIPNPELYTLLLGFGADIRVLSPQRVVDEMRKQAEKLYRVYSET